MRFLIVVAGIESGLCFVFGVCADVAAIVPRASRKADAVTERLKGEYKKAWLASPKRPVLAIRFILI